MTSRLRFAMILLFAAATACQSGSPGPAGGGFRSDLEKICNAKALSGADLEPGGQGTYAMAQWLSANVTSSEGHAFLVEFAKLGQDREARRKKLTDAVAQYRLARCPLIEDWR